MLESVILGDGMSFVPSVTFREKHDRLLVLSQLGLWAKMHGAQQRAAQAVLNSVREACRRQDLDTALDIIWCTLLLMEDDAPAPAVDFAEVGKELKDLYLARREGTTFDQELTALVSAVQARLPDLLG